MKNEENETSCSRDNMIVISEDGEFVREVEPGFSPESYDNQVVDWIVLEDGERIPITREDEHEIMLMAFMQDMSPEEQDRFRRCLI